MPQPEGSWPFIAPRALPGCPRAVERSSTALGRPGSASTALGRPGSTRGAKNGHVPEGWGVEITFLFIRAHPSGTYEFICGARIWRSGTDECIWGAMICLNQY